MDVRVRMRVRVRVEDEQGPSSPSPSPSKPVAVTFARSLRGETRTQLGGHKGPCAGTYPPKRMWEDGFQAGDVSVRAGEPSSARGPVAGSGCCFCAAVVQQQVSSAPVDP